MAPFAGGQDISLQGQEPSGHRGFDPQAIFGPTKYQRLLDVKRRYDPDDLFHVNHNIPTPAASR